MSLPTLDIRTVARLVGLSDGVLYSWVRKRTIVPAVVGCHGRWTPHHFSVPQVLALCYVVAERTVLVTGKNMTLKDITQRMAEVQSDICDEDVEAWVSGQLSPWEEERVAAGKDELDAELASQDALAESHAVESVLRRYDREVSTRVLAVLTHLRGLRQQRERMRVWVVPKPAAPSKPQNLRTSKK
jgi:hypothetical protein